MRFVFLLALFVFRPGSEDLYEGLFDPISAQAQFASTRYSVVLTTTEEQVFWERTQEGAEQATRETLANTQNRIATLDQATRLPPRLAEQYREEQKRLRAVHSRLAQNEILREQSRPVPSQRKLVDAGDLAIERSMLEKGPEQEIPDLLQGRLRSSSNQLSQAAALALKRIEDPQLKAEFQSWWEASHADNRARKSLGTYVASLGLHGVQAMGLDTLRGELNQYATDYQKARKKDPEASLNKAEVGDYVARSLRGREEILTFPIRRSLKRIEELEHEARFTSSVPRFRELARLLEMEKEALVKTLGKEGLAVNSDAVLSAGVLEKRMLAWFQSKKIARQALKWPFEGQAIILENFEKDKPFTFLKTHQLHGILAPCDGQVQVREDAISVQCPRVLFHFQGQLDALIDSGAHLKAGDRIAFVPEPYELFVSAESLRTTTPEPKDFLSFF